MGRANVGGPALQAVALQRYLDADRFECRLIVGRTEPGEENYLRLRAPDIESRALGSRGRMPAIADVSAFIRLVREIREFRPHVVHTHAAKAGVLGRLAAFVCRVPVTVHTFHGHLLDGYFSRPVLRVVVAVERVLARRTTALISVGAAVRDRLLAERIGVRDQFTVVPPGIALSAFEQIDAGAKVRLRDEESIPRDAIVVGFVGRLVPIKRVDRLAEVFELLAAELPTAHFVVIGDGPTRVSLDDVGTVLGQRLHLLGWRSDIPAWLSAIDVVLNTSENEGMPVAAIEAAAAGCPVVATDVGSTREVVQHGCTGFVMPYDAAAFAKAVVEVASDTTARNRLGANARQRAIDLFSEGRLVRDIETLYERLVAQSPRRDRNA